MMPPALGRFSTITVWPIGFSIACATTRATVSVGPPAAYGTSMLTLCVGYCCAAATAATAEITRPMMSFGKADIGCVSARLLVESHGDYVIRVVLSPDESQVSSLSLKR